MENVYLLAKDYMYEYKDGRVVKKEIKKEKGIFTSLIYFKDIFNNTFKLPVDLTKEELFIKAEEYIFNESSLDLNKEYKISFCFKKFEDYYLVDAFIVDVNILEKQFKPLLKKVEYIDFISPAFFVFEEYYNINNILPENDIFIYFTEEDAFIAGFKNKKFLFVKSLDKFSTLLTATDLKSEELIKLLKEKGLKKELYEDEHLFNQIDTFFSHFFMKVSNLINYSKNFYHIETFNYLYFYSNIEINNLFETYKPFWDLSSIIFKKFEIESEYDPFEYCATLYNAKHLNDEEINLSPFIRPPKFYKTQIGQFIIFSLFVIFLLLADAGYKYSIINKQENKILKLQQYLKQKDRKVKLTKNYIEKYKEKIKKEKVQITNVETQINDIYAKINYLYNIKTGNSVFNEFAQVLNFTMKNGLNILTFKKDDNHLNITIQSTINNSSLIAKFLKMLLQAGYKNVSSKKIENNKNSYLTVIKYSDE